MARWRYCTKDVTKHVVGRDANGVFIFDEATREVRRFEGEASFERAAAARQGRAVGSGF